MFVVQCMTMIMIEIIIQGDPKKMHDSVLKLKSVLKVRFYFPACVLESEFRAWLIWPPKNAFSESKMSQKRQKRLQERTLEVQLILSSLR